MCTHTMVLKTLKTSQVSIEADLPTPTPRPKQNQSLAIAPTCEFNSGLGSASDITAEKAGVLITRNESASGRRDGKRNLRPGFGMTSISMWATEAIGHNPDVLSARPQRALLLQFLSLNAASSDSRSVQGVYIDCIIRPGCVTQGL